MYECQIVEIEDVKFCHFINHYDELESDYLTYEESIEYNDFVNNNEYDEY